MGCFFLIWILAFVFFASQRDATDRTSLPGRVSHEEVSSQLRRLAEYAAALPGITPEASRGYTLPPQTFESAGGRRRGANGRERSRWLGGGSHPLASVAGSPGGRSLVDLQQAHTPALAAVSGSKPQAGQPAGPLPSAGADSSAKFHWAATLPSMSWSQSVGASSTSAHPHASNSSTNDLRALLERKLQSASATPQSPAQASFPPEPLKSISSLANTSPPSARFPAGGLPPFALASRVARQVPPSQVPRWLADGTMGGSVHTPLTELSSEATSSQKSAPLAPGSKSTAADSEEAVSSQRGVPSKPGKSPAAKAGDLPPPGGSDSPASGAEEILQSELSSLAAGSALEQGRQLRRDVGRWEEQLQRSNQGLAAVSGLEKQLMERGQSLVQDVKAVNHMVLDEVKNAKKLKKIEVEQFSTLKRHIDFLIPQAEQTGSSGGK
eukprot:GHVT01096275.1.p1 GENE.GHVT01096275.1~~GHVT01096275.1.p1  ORF type:complete len:439 (-),score=119.75 GHVT01096275.1:26-1342(-)